MRRSIVNLAAPVLIVLFVLTLALAYPASAQCVMCRTALKSPEGKAVAGAFRSAILFLLAAPFAVFGLVAALAARRFRRTPDPGKA